MSERMAEPNKYRDGRVNDRNTSTERSSQARQPPTDVARVQRSASPERVAEAVAAMFEFELAGQRYALPITHVREVLPLATLIPLLEAPTVLAGCLRLRGTLLPVLDLRRRLDLPPIAPRLSQCIVVAQIGPSIFGLLIDGAGDIIALEETPVRVTAEDSIRLVRCVVELSDRVVTILNPDALVGAEVATFLVAVLGQDASALAVAASVSHSSETVP